MLPMVHSLHYYYYYYFTVCKKKYYAFFNNNLRKSLLIAPITTCPLTEITGAEELALSGQI